jgi:alkylated DNA repair dioxygenase AlkB
MDLEKSSANKPRNADTLKQSAAAIDPTTATQSQSQQQPTRSDAVNDTTTTVHLGVGLQLGWRDDGDHQVKHEQVIPSTGAPLPPPVRTNAAEAAELLGTETDVEDDVANLLTLTKTDL